MTWTPDRKANIYEMYAQLAEELMEDHPEMDWQKGFDSKFWYVNVVPMINRINKQHGFKPINNNEAPEEEE